MSAVVDVRGPTAKHTSTHASPFLTSFNLIGKAPFGAVKLRELILTLAVEGRLVVQIESEAPADELLALAEAARAAAVGRRTRGPSRKTTPDQGASEAPAGWCVAALGDVAIRITDGSHNPPADAGAGIPMLSSQNVRDGYVDFSSPSRYVSEHDFLVEDARTRVVPGDVLLTIVASIGRSAVVPCDAPRLALQRSVAVIRSPLNSHYLSIVFRSRLARTYYDKHGKGTAQKGIYLGKLAEMPIPIPPLAEQQRIVARVEELMTLCDALEQNGRLADVQHACLTSALFDALAVSESAHTMAENWGRVAEHFDLLLDRPDSVDALEQTILQLAVRGLLVAQDAEDGSAAALVGEIELHKKRLVAQGKLKSDRALAAVEATPFEIPSSWEWVRLGSIGEAFDYGTSQKSVDDPSAVPVLRMGNVQAGKVVMTGLKYLIDQQNDLPGLLLRPGDLLFNRTNSYELVGKTGLYEGFRRDVTFASYLIRIRLPADLCSAQYVNMYMNTIDCRRHEIEPDLTQQTGQANYNGTKLRNIRVPLPPLGEQRRIVARVQELRDLCNGLRQRLTQAREAQSRLADVLVAEVA